MKCPTATGVEQIHSIEWE